MEATNKRVLFWVVSFSFVAASCATHGPATGAAPIAAAPPSVEAASVVVLASTTAAPSTALRLQIAVLVAILTATRSSEAYGSFKGLAEGRTLVYILILASVDPKLYGLVLTTVQGGLRGRERAGRVLDPAVSKPFTVARGHQDGAGAETVELLIGVIGHQKFNSILGASTSSRTSRPTRITSRRRATRS